MVYIIENSGTTLQKKDKQIKCRKNQPNKKEYRIISRS